MRIPLLSKFQFTPLSWLLFSLSSIVLASSPAEAGRLIRWEFDRDNNQLEFTTDERVQPQALLLSNPSRLVIDLPGTDLGRPSINRRVGGAITSIRLGQFDANTTRLVIEIAPGYTIDPDKVEFRGVNPTQWYVQIPKPEKIADAPESPDTEETQPPVISSSTLFRVTNSGLLVNIGDEEAEEIEVKPDRRGDLVKIEVRGVTLAEDLVDQILPVESDVVSQVKFTQPSSDLAVITLNVPKDGPGWRVTEIESLNSLLIYPEGGGNFEVPTVATPPAETEEEEVSQAPAPSQNIPVPPPETNEVPKPEKPDIPTGPPIDGRVLVMIDPGHGGKDPGAIGIGGLREVDVVLPISLEMAQILQSNNVQVRLTRDEDFFVSLAGRTQMANGIGADIFVSVHANAAPGARSSVNGIETFYHVSGRSLATYIQNAMIERFDMNNRGVKQARFYVLRNSRMPSALVEVGFVTGGEDSRKLSDPAFRSQMAEAIAEGILRYIRATGG